MKDLTLVIPAKFEPESLPKVLDELKKYNFKISVILHSSDTKTIKSIKKYKVKVIKQKNKGYGDAIIQGIYQCKTDFFCIFNADGSFNPSEIKYMMKSLNKNKLDFIFASRYEKNSGSDDDTWVTYIGNYFFTKIGNIFFNLPITDILYTFVLGKTNSAKKLNLTQKNFSFCVELPIKAKRQNMKIASIASFERKRIAGKKKVNEIKDGIIILIYIIKFFFK